VLRGKLLSFTKHTPVDHAEIQRRTEKAFAQGYCFSEQGFEDEVSGVAAPFFGASGALAGTVAIAMPSSRMTAARRADATSLVLEASAQITAALGGVAHPNVPTSLQPAEAAE
jgi:DNA-binding IclR family transcriptional regulator